MVKGCDAVPKLRFRNCFRIRTTTGTNSHEYFSNIRLTRKRNPLLILFLLLFLSRISGIYVWVCVYIYMQNWIRFEWKLEFAFRKLNFRFEILAYSWERRLEGEAVLTLAVFTNTRKYFMTFPFGLDNSTLGVDCWGTSMLLERKNCRDCCCSDTYEQLDAVCEMERKILIEDEWLSIMAMYLQY